VRVVGRFILILFACLVASVAAGLVITLAVLLPEFGELALDTLDRGTFGLIVAFGAIFVSGFALLPVLVMIVIAEALRLRSLLFYAAAGAGVSVLLYLHVRGYDTLAFRVDGFARRELEIMAAAGIVAGFVYWAIAGRNAGSWRKLPPPTRSPHPSP
jgi:hypothetical protein